MSTDPFTVGYLAATDRAVNELISRDAPAR